MTLEATATRRAEIEALRRLSRPALWVIAARLKTLSLSVAPVLAGTWYAAAHGAWRLDVLLVAIISAVAIQIGTNLWNDAADAACGVDTEERLGPPRVTALGLLEPPAVRRAALTSFAVAGVAGLYLAAIGGWPILAIGFASLALGYLYSMGPIPLSMTPFGELLVILFFGVAAVAGTAYLHTGSYDPGALRLGAVLGLPAAAVLLINNHRDRRTDVRAGRRTLAILLGETGARLLYAAFLLATVFGICALQGTTCGAANPVLWLHLALALSLAFLLLRTPISAALNRLIPATAFFQLLAIAALASGPGFCP